jgi:predicted membrane-bound spermidine synthase
MKLLAKKIGIHAALMVLMVLSLYLGQGILSPLKLESMRLLAAMGLGAYAVKPLADWVCQKVL